MGCTCIVVSGGDHPPARVAGLLPLADLVVAADGGLDHAEALGLAVDLVVGDLDSVSEDALARARLAGVEVEQHDVAKDETDLELALGAAIARGADHIVVVSGGGGRLDHLLAGALALAGPATQGRVVEAWIGPAWVGVVQGPGRVELDGRPGELVTLLAVGGPATGVRTEGLRFPLHTEPLAPGSSRGVSNELLGRVAAVELAGGCLLVVQPDALEVGP